MNSQAYPFARYAKIIRPQIPYIVQRKRLNHLVQKSLKDFNLWIEGPAGSGKSTLINSYLDTVDVSCVWYRIDERDVDIGNFFFYLGKAAEAAAPGAEPVLPVLTPEYLLDLPAFTRNFFSLFFQRIQSAHIEHSSSDYVIIFDDYHLVPQESPLHNLMLIALSELPSDVRLIFISRTSMPQMFVPAQANRKLSIIGWNDIRLTEDESIDIVRHLSQVENIEQLGQALHQCVRGWVAGLILLLEHVKRVDDYEFWQEHIPAQIYDYFAGTVFDSVDDQIKTVLLKTAFLPFMTPEMSCQLSDCANAEAIHERLYRDNFFIEKQQHGDTPVYLYHALFREFLLGRAQQMLTHDELMLVRRQAGVNLNGSRLSGTGR